MSKETLWIILGIIIVLFLGFVFFGGEAQAPSSLNEDMEIIGDAAKKDLAASGFIKRDVEIKIKRVSPKEWPDACLGVNEPNKFCAEVITPGYEIVLEAEEKEFIYRSDENGDILIFYK